MGSLQRAWQPRVPVQSSAADRYRPKPEPGVALVDLGLSDGSSGAALARRLIDRFQIKVIFVTGRPGAVGRGLEGSRDVIGKPFSDESVRRSLAKAANA